MSTRTLAALLPPTALLWSGRTLVSRGADVLPTITTTTSKQKNPTSCSRLYHHPPPPTAALYLLANSTRGSSSSSIRWHYRYAGPGRYDARNSVAPQHHRSNYLERGFTVGIGGPVGSGKTALVLELCHLLRKQRHVLPLGVVTNDIFTREDAEFLVRHEALPNEKYIRAVETGGCPHAAIREDVSANLHALEQLTHELLLSEEEEEEDDRKSIIIPLLLCESGGDNLAANFSRELADVTLYVIDVAGGDKIPRKGGPGITQSDLLIINKTDLADAVGADLDVMKRDAAIMRGGGGEDDGPTVLASVKHKRGVQEICDFILSRYKEAITAAGVEP